MPSDSVVMIAQLGGEPITYTPHGAVAKTIKAIVQRTPPAPQGGRRAGYLERRAELWIAIDATDGVTAIKERFDTVAFKFNVDDPTVTELKITKVLEQDLGVVPSDGGMFHVEAVA